MFGFVVAGLSLAGLILLARKRRGYYRGYGLYRLFRKLDTTPGQERAIRNIVSDLRDAARDTFSKSRQARPELGEIFEGNRFEEERLRSFLEARKGELGGLEEQFVKALKQIHEVLDDEQRKRVAGYLSRERFFFGHHHGYHGHQHCC